MSLPRVAVIIPAYNMERFIERTLLSAVGQTYPNLEIIVIDDGSTDRTADIVGRFACEHPQVRMSTVANAGLAAARNLGTVLADSPYVAYLDADDVWAPTKIEKQMAALAAHGGDGEWAGCYALHRMIDEADRVLGDGAASQERGDFFDEHLIWNPIGNGSNLLVRRDAALAVGGFNPDYAKAGIGGCEDLEFQLKLLRRYKIEVVREYLVGYRLHPGQMSRDIVRMRLGQIAVIEAMTAEASSPKATRDRALVETYLVAAKGYLLVRDWRNALKWASASVTVSPGETATKVARQLSYEVAYWSQRLAGAIRPSRQGPAARTFYSLEPREGVETGSRVAAPYRAAMLAGARARSSSLPSASPARSDAGALDPQTLPPS